MSINLESLKLDQLEKTIFDLKPVVDELSKNHSIETKLSIINEYVDPTLFHELQDKWQYLLKALTLIGQFEKIIPELEKEKLFFLLTDLNSLENFYSDIGGIIGYHYKILQLLVAKLKKGSIKNDNIHYYPPKTIDFSNLSPYTLNAVSIGIENLDKIAELYPVGGAADRLCLYDEERNQELPAAKLPFFGKTLLQILIFDVQAREYLYYKLFNKQITTPIAMMTSSEKDNHHHILSICENNHWFFRGKENFCFFKQPNVPTIDLEGNWCLKEKGILLKKPGGHGVIWKLAKDQNVFSWLKKNQRTKGLIRQINNPLSGLDYALLALLGHGISHDMDFGFLSCDRLLGAKEGICVLVEEKNENHFSYFLTNIEHCDLEKRGFEDLPDESNQSISQFPSNTNILFTDLNAMEKACSQYPFPGALVNFKESNCYENKSYQKKEVARLEATMQNICDVFISEQEEQLTDLKKATDKTFIVFNQRSKTISPAKKAYIKGQSTLETPQRSYYDCLKNAHELLSFCKLHMPDFCTLETYLLNGPSCIFTYNPSLGPLYSIICQKIKGGALAPFAEVQIEIAELDWENVDVEGSLLIVSHQMMGHMEEDKLVYSEKSGKCSLKNVKVRNQGIDRSQTKEYWKNGIVRKEVLSISLYGNGEFIAEEVTLEGSLHFDVEDGMRMRVFQEKNSLYIRKEKIEKPSWYWEYLLNENKEIKLTRRML